MDSVVSMMTAAGELTRRMTWEHEEWPLEGEIAAANTSCNGT